MSEVTITVRGEHEVRVTPERATVHFSVRGEGPDRTRVLDHVGRAAVPVRDDVKARSDAGTLLDWSSTRLSVRADRPWNAEGKRLAPLYRASMEFTVVFADFDEMSLWATEVSERDGVELGHVDWALTAETRQTVEQEVATEAIRVALRRAKAYAAALGRAEVIPLSIADEGLLQQQQSTGPLMRGAAFASAASDGVAMEFEPADIVVSATVEARFTAR